MMSHPGPHDQKVSDTQPHNPITPYPTQEVSILLVSPLPSYLMANRELVILLLMHYYHILVILCHVQQNVSGASYSTR